MERSHGRLLLQVMGVDVRGVVLEIYKVSLLRILKSVECLVRAKKREG